MIAGSFVGWGEPLLADVDLVVFVDTPTPLRMERLRARERQRFGARIEPGGDRHAAHLAFAEWASRYDDPSHSGRNRAMHEAWLAGLRLRVLRLDGPRRPAVSQRKLRPRFPPDGDARSETEAVLSYPSSAPR